MYKHAPVLINTHTQANHNINNLDQVHTQLVPPQCPPRTGLVEVINLIDLQQLANLLIHHKVIKTVHVPQDCISMFKALDQSVRS